MRRRLLAGAVAAGLLLGCGGGPREEERLADDLVADYDLDRPVAECVADQLYERFTSEEIETFREADGDRDNLPEDLLSQLRTAVVPCASAGS